MNVVNRFQSLNRVSRWSLGYLIVWMLLVFELRTSQRLPIGLHALFSSLAIPWGVFWLRYVAKKVGVSSRKEVDRSDEQRKWMVGTFVFVLWWHLTLVMLDFFAWDAARSTVARIGTLMLYAVGLFWLVWWIERASAFYAKSHPVSRERQIWNPLDLRAWYYAVQWWPLPITTLLRFCLRPKQPQNWSYTSRSRKLDQSIAALMSYSLVFLLLSLLFGQLRGCREIYEMPAGGGEAKQLAQVVKIKKVIRKKYVINPLSAITFSVPPIDQVALNLMEITEHAYSVGYGEGKGAGFAGGTFHGKVRFIRLEYSGGDWDQDFGIGGDLNMLLEYGIRTSHQVAEKTESRTIGQLDNFPIGKSPPVVYMTGQRNISLSNAEVKTLRDYLAEKHGMLFADNGGSRHFHNQFIEMMRRVLPDVQAVPIPLDDVIHRIPYQIPYLPYVAPHGGKEALGWYQDGRWLAYYHPGDIGDAWADGHAGVSPDIWESCYRTGTNVIFYAHSEYAKWLQSQKND